MRCPFCSYPDSRTADSRPDGEGRLRRRQCPRCRKRFKTSERVVREFPQIVKSDGRREPYDVGKLRHSVDIALSKRAVPTRSRERALADIEESLLRQASGGEFESRQLGSLVMRQLRRLDEVAYIRYASVYHAFGDMDAFLRQIDQLRNDLSSEIRRRQLPLLPGGGGGEDD